MSNNINASLVKNEGLIKKIKDDHVDVFAKASLSKKKEK